MMHSYKELAEETKTLLVLILVVMDDALVQVISLVNNGDPNVLILVVMDDALVQKNLCAKNFAIWS